MICIVCKKHATFDHTFFRGPTPHKVTLCGECETKTGAHDHIAKIKGAPDKAAKHAAVEEFLKAVGR